MISGIVTASLLLAFIGITAWAYSSRNRARFEAAARLPLHEDGVHPAQACGTPACCCTKENES